MSPKRKPKAAKKGKAIEVFESKSEAVRRLVEELQECKSRLAKQEKTIAAQNKLIKKQEKQIIALKAAFESTLQAIKD